MFLFTKSHSSTEAKNEKPTYSHALKGGDLRRVLRSVRKMHDLIENM